MDTQVLILGALALWAFAKGKITGNGGAVPGQPSGQIGVVTVSNNIWLANRIYEAKFTSRTRIGL